MLFRSPHHHLLLSVFLRVAVDGRLLFQDLFGEHQFAFHAAFQSGRAAEPLFDLCDASACRSHHRLYQLHRGHSHLAGDPPLADHLSLCPEGLCGEPEQFGIKDVGAVAQRLQVKCRRRGRANFMRVSANEICLLEEGAEGTSPFRGRRAATASEVPKARKSKFHEGICE